MAGMCSGHGEEAGRAGLDRVGMVGMVVMSLASLCSDSDQRMIQQCPEPGCRGRGGTRQSVRLGRHRMKPE